MSGSSGIDQPSIQLPQFFQTLQRDGPSGYAGEVSR